jgi:hypothetical protein
MTTTALTRRAAMLAPLLALTLIACALLAGRAAAQVPPPIPGQVGLPTLPVLPGPGFEPYQLRQFDCHTYYLPTLDPTDGRKLETVVICYGLERVPGRP